MAGIPSPDPIPAVHQVLALAELPELDDYERNLLAWQRDALLGLKNNASPQAWLDWYRGLLGAVGQLQSRWQQAKPEPLFAARSAEDNPHAAALQRVKEAPTLFLQRWNVRIQDQAAAHKATLPTQVVKAPIVEGESATHLTFGVERHELQKVSQYALHVLNSWSEDVEGKLPASWLRHVHAAATAEALPRPSITPPAWPPLKLGMSAIPPPTLEQRAIRRPTLFAAFLRTFQSVRGIASPILTILAGLMTTAAGILVAANVLDPKSTDTKLIASAAIAVLALVTTFAAIATALFLSRRQLTDDLAQIRADERQRLHTALQAWALGAIDGHKTRLQTLVSAASAEMKSRTAEWADATWGSRRGSPPADRQRDMGPLLSSLGTARAALAVRVAQLQFEIGAPAPSQ